MKERRKAKLRYLGLCAGGLMMMLWLSSCALWEGDVAPVLPSDNVTVMVPAVMEGGADAVMTLLGALLPDAETVPMSEFEQAARRCLDENRVLVIPESAYFPVCLAPALQRYYEGGGSLLLLGRSPFSQRVRREEDRWITKEEHHDRLFEQAREVPGLSTVQLWRHENNSGVVRGTVRVARHYRLPWPGVDVEIRDLDIWDRMRTFDLEPGRIGEEENTLLLMVRADSPATTLAIECEERDGSLWRTVVPVRYRWERRVVHEADFAYAGGGRNRGGADDGFRLSALRELSIGLNNEAAPQWPGDHRFGISDVRVASDPRPNEQAVGWPLMGFDFSPAMIYETVGDRVRSLHTAADHPAGGVVLQSPFPLPDGTGGAGAFPGRWIPLYEILDRDGRSPGWAASIHIHPVPDASLRKVAWVGMDYARASREALAVMISDTVQAMQRERFLYQAGMERYVFRSGERFEFSTRLTAGPGDEGVLRVAAELLDRQGGILRRTVSAPLRPADVRALDQPLNFTLGVAPAQKDGAEDYTLRLVLEDIGYAGRVYDMVRQPIKVLPPADPPDPEDRPRVVGSRILVGRIPVFLLGAHYRSPVRLPESSDAPPGHWLDVGIFSPARVREDLTRMRGVGFNAVAVEYRHEGQASPLRYFIEEADARGLWVHVRLPGGSGREDVARMIRMIQAAGLHEKRNVISLDIGLRLDRNDPATAATLDEAWSEWIQEQFGSSARAEEILGRPLWRRGGRLTAPPAEVSEADESTRAALATYRRFMEDYAGRRYGYVSRSLRGAGIQQLLTAEAAVRVADPAMAIDPAAGAAHVDLMLLSAEGMTGDRSRFMEAGFVTAYARGVSDRKPVVWTQFGSPLPEQFDGNDLEYQSSIHEHMHELIFKSRGIGGFGREYSPWPERKVPGDFGMVNPDGIWRPVEAVYRKAVSRMREERGAPQAWTGREFVRSVAGGLPELWEAWRDVYREETGTGRMEEIRPTGFNQPVSDIMLLAVGERPHVSPGPMEQVNAEWGYLEIDGRHHDRLPGERIRVYPRQRIRAELINTGSAQWEASRDGADRTVWVRVEHSDRLPHHIPMNHHLSFGQRTWVSWMVADEGVSHARPHLWGVGSFGEALVFEVQETDRAE